MESNTSRAKGDRETYENHPIYSMVISRPAVEFPNQARLVRAVSGTSQMGLCAQGIGGELGDVYALANDLSDPRVFCLGRCNDPLATMVKEGGGDGGNVDRAGR